LIPLNQGAAVGQTAVLIWVRTRKFQTHILVKSGAAAGLACGKDIEHVLRDDHGSR
jgi:hypothetical protein